MALFGLPMVSLPLLSALPGQAMAQSASQQFQIAAGPLGTSLSLFATRAGITLTFDARQTQGRQSAALQGNFSVEDGLARLLAGSGLRAQRQSNGGFLSLINTSQPTRIRRSSYSGLFLKKKKIFSKTYRFHLFYY
ncbi:STN domain-containing protein [Pseudomonas sp. Marseille-P9899]|uniref:STN domain-containing protein n=1 Tax=Pseudomonas sp. Marseille-P9899 TaxID=2730401 RepID=UPI0021144F32|nr:STN domain-containing protein [Pseudomonas sp. Marseille-P9899]